MGWRGQRSAIRDGGGNSAACYLRARQCMATACTQQFEAGNFCFCLPVHIQDMAFNNLPCTLVGMSAMGSEDSAAAEVKASTFHNC